LPSAGISQATYVNWKKKYDGLLPTEMKRLKRLEDEKSKLRKLVALVARQGDASGRDPLKTVRPGRKRELDRQEAVGPNEVWAMDFVHDQPAAGTNIGVLAVVDTFRGGHR